VRDEVLEVQSNIVISASAGTGKTYTIIERILRDIQKNNAYKVYAAITFTRKATKEIKTRIGLNIGNGFIGTNDSFVMQEIIQPFIRDAYGEEYNKKLTPDYSNERATDSYNELLEIIKKSEEGYVCKYSDFKKNFGFELALNILKKSYVCRRYMKSKYFRIYVDEYQDCDKDMHKFFTYLSDTLKIPLFIVGDTKQSIYEWRGGYPKGFEDLIKDESNFKSFRLSHNFRSNIQIQNYSNIFMDDVREYYTPCEILNEIQYLKYSNIKEDEVLKLIRSWCNEEKTIALLVKVNSFGEEYANYLKQNNINMTYIPHSPLDNSGLESNHVWVARCIATYLLQKNYSEYDFFDEIPMPESYDFKRLKKLLQNIKNNVSKDNEKYFKKYCREVYEYLVDTIDEERYTKEIEKLLESIRDNKYLSTYNQHLYKHIITTIHSSKGLQYDQVIIISSDYFHYNKFDEQLHYVAVSRPKEKLLILLRDNIYTKKIYECINKGKEIGLDIDIEDLIVEVS